MFNNFMEIDNDNDKDNKKIDLSNQNLSKLPDLSTYSNLDLLDCRFNKINHLNNLPN
jgi:hypothetical protein